jgi:aminodeoxyfutalosine synthase
MATAHLDTLAPIRNKVLAGGRLDVDDGIALLECDDLLALGDLADSARKLRGGGDDVYFSDVEQSPPDPADVPADTLVYGRGEAPADRIEQLLRLRELQDSTGEITSFLPLPIHADSTTGHDDIQMVAVSRLMLDNVPDIRVNAALVTTPLAQVALAFGANELEGPPAEEQVLLIREAGRNPVKR